MQNRITHIYEEREQKNNGPRPIGEILKELLRQYEARFPNLRITIVETPANAISWSNV